MFLKLKMTKLPELTSQFYTQFGAGTLGSSEYSEINQV